MRGLWENEKPLSPAMLRSALMLVGAFLALCSAAVIVAAVGAAANGHWVAAAIQLTAGIAIPFGVWLVLRMLADMLIVLHRSQARLEAIVQAAGGTVPMEADPVFASNGAATGRAGDDGPAYPAED